MKFGELLRDLRRRAGLTQLELATAVEVSERTVRSWEADRPPPVSKASRIAALLGLTGTQYSQFMALAAGRDPDELPQAIAAATRTLPRDIASFTGRADELNALEAAVASAPRAGGVPQICVIHGMPGVGKTRLAVHFAHLVAASYPDGQFFADLYGHSAERRPVDPAEELSALLLAAGLPRQVIPDSIDERAAVWRDWAANRRTLLLLDDAKSAAQVIPLLPGSAGHLVLITSRNRFAELPDATALPVDVMTTEDAAELFTRLADRPGLRPESVEVTDIVALSGGLPVVIAPLAGQLRQHPTWRVSDLGARLNRGGGRLGLPAADRGPPGSQMAIATPATVADAVGLSYQTLPDELQQMFRRLALHPGPDIDPAAAAALDDLDPDVAARLLARLFDYHLIDELAPERYRFHDLVRDYAVALVAADPADEVSAAERRLLDYYFRTAWAADRYVAQGAHTGMPAAENAARTTADAAAQILSRADAFEWMDGNFRHLHAAAEHAWARGYRDYANLIPAVADQYLTRRGHWTELLSLQRLAVRAAGEADQPDADLAGRARALADLGWIEYMLGDLSSAARDLDEAEALQDRLGDRLGRALAVARRGAIAFATGDYASAESSWATALTAFRQGGSRAGEADTLIRLGTLRYQTGEIEAASAALSAARDMCAELDDPLGQATALCYLGEVLRELGRYDDAIASCQAGLTLYRELGDPWNAAGARFYLGVALRAAGRLAEARTELDAALVVYRDAGDDYDEAEVLNQLGILQTSTGDLATAAGSLAQALVRYERWGSESGKTEVFNSLGELALATGDPAGAERHFRRALATAESKDIMREEARAREGIGRACLGTGRQAEADGQFRASHAIYQKLQSPAAGRLAALLESGLGAAASP